MGDTSNDVQHEETISADGEMAKLVRSTDWAATPLGPSRDWPVSLRTTVAMLLEARHPMLLFWGPELIQFYNDAFRPSLGADKHPAALGQRAPECWADAWPIVGAQVEAVIALGESTWNENFLVPIDRGGRREEVYWTYGYSPVRDDDGKVNGVLVVVTETTGAVVGQRRLRTLADLAAQTADAATPDAVCRTAVRVLADNPNDVPFALVYLVDAERGEARLVGATGVAAAAPAAPVRLNLRADTAAAWAIGRVSTTGTAQVVDVPDMAAPLPGGPWPESPTRALILPIARAADDRSAGVLVAGISPRRPLDDDYRRFLTLVADRIATGMAKARAYEEERRRAETLAELDRAKTAFFSNVSHEFRTPLTLLLGLTEEALLTSTDDPPALRGEDLHTVHRNGLRLLRLVNTLLDFARIEAGRAHATYEPTDLGAYTAELAGTFRSAIEAAGLDLHLGTPALPEPVHVDREMWEKIVLNLLSNALRFTTTGAISVALRPADGAVELEVRDTGSGIPAEELPHVFERFHRGAETPVRAQRGTGIGLALVRDLVSLHGGSASIESEVGRGTIVRVRIPTGTAHLPQDRIGRGRADAAGITVREEDVLPWLPDGMNAGVAHGDDDPPTTGPRVLLADDNAEMRQYVARLLRQKGYRVEIAEDGAAALAVARRDRPDLVLADVMMPRLDGFGLLRELRREPGTRDVPVLLVSARAGEESRVEGLEAGADDYIVKPFSARELLARVEAHLALANLRRESQERLTRLFMQAPVAVCVVTGPTFVFELANPLYLRMVGRRDIVGQTFREAFPELPDDAPVLRMLQDVYETGTPFVAHEYPVSLDRHGDGTLEELCFMLTCQPVRTGRDGETSIMTVAVDVTEQVQARREVEQARLVAQAANQAKATFLATMSHELRTPLNAIIGYSDLLDAQIEGPLTPGQQKQLERIEIAARHLLQIIEEILTFSRLEAKSEDVHPMRVDLAELMREMATLVEPLAAARRLEFTCDTPAHLEVVTDPGKVRQILLNLLSNAVKFTDRGAVRLELQQEDGEALMRVRDTGIGISADALGRIFEPFSQVVQETTRSVGGTGLGLTVTRQLAELLGGDVSVESVPGRGSTFTVRLPVDPTRPLPSAEPR